MHVLYLTDRLSHRGGAQHHLLDVIEAMAAHHTVTVAAASKDADVALPPSVSFHKVGGLRSSNKSLEALDALMQSVDIVHLQNVMRPEAIERATEKPTVVTIQDHRSFCPGPGRTLTDGTACNQPMSDSLCTPCVPDPDRREQLLNATHATQTALRKAEHFVVLSSYMAREVDAVGLAPATVIPPPVKPNPHTITAGHGFLMAGRMVHLKGPDLGYRAWQEADIDHPLRIAGLGSALGNMTDAHQLGWLDRDSLRSEMASARAVLFPGRWQEPFGIVGAEALAMGTPVIATPVGGMADWCGPGTIAVESQTEMAEAIRLLANNPSHAASLGTQGRNRINALCNPDRVHQKLTSVYTRLADQ